MIRKAGRSARLLVVGTVLAAAAPVQAEVKLGNDQEAGAFFGSVCGYCHEDGGRRAGKGPQLMGTARTDDYMANRIATGRPGRMPAFGGTLNADQIQAIIHYIRNLKPREGSG